MRLAASLVAFFVSTLASFAAEARPAATPALRVAALASPAGAGSLGASLVTAPDGTAWLTWLEPVAGTEKMALRFATFDASARQWSAAKTIASGVQWYASAADFPALTVGPGGRATAVWFVNNPPSAATAHLHHGAGHHALFSQTTDGGKTWSAPAPLSRESDMVEFVSLATLADGRVLAAWLDAREKKTAPPHAHGTPGPAQKLYARIVGTSGPDTLVDGSVCDCCQTTLTAFLDGSALLAYRGRSGEEIRDIRLSHFRDDRWEPSRPLHADNWKILGCPVNGPQLASDGGRVAAAWFTAEGNDPRVHFAFSPDAGARFLMPLRIDTAKAAGRVDTLLLRDGAALVTWATIDGALWLRRVSPDYALSENVALAPAGAASLKTVARAAVVRDYSGGRTPAEIVVAFAQEGAGGGVRTLLVTVPEGELLEAEKNCDCAPAAGQLQGFPIRGTIAAVNARDGTLRLEHGALPGVFVAGTRDFKVSAEVLTAAAQPGRQILGRAEPRDGAWWLSDVRFIAAPAK